MAISAERKNNFIAPVALALSLVLVPGNNLEKPITDPMAQKVPEAPQVAMFEDWDQIFKRPLRGSFLKLKNKLS